MSPGVSDDDRQWASCDPFRGVEVVVLEKRDGECTTLKPDDFHARSPDSSYHPTQSWVKRLYQYIRHDIPEGWRICGENMQARHTIPYTREQTNALSRGYFEVFSIWNADGDALSWDETVEWCQMLGLPTVPVLDRGLWDREWFESIVNRLDPARQEGVVVRRADAFHESQFRQSIAKWVSSNFKAALRASDEHWKFGHGECATNDVDITYHSVEGLVEAIRHDRLDPVPNRDVLDTQ